MNVRGDRPANAGSRHASAKELREGASWLTSSSWRLQRPEESGRTSLVEESASRPQAVAADNQLVMQCRHPMLADVDVATRVNVHMPWFDQTENRSHKVSGGVHCRAALRQSQPAMKRKSAHPNGLSKTLATCVFPGEIRTTQLIDPSSRRHECRVDKRKLYAFYMRRFASGRLSKARRKTRAAATSIGGIFGGSAVA